MKTKVPKFTVVKQIIRDQKRFGPAIYHEAHSEADKAEKKKYPLGYEKLKHLGGKSYPKNKLMAANSKSGKITVAKQVGKFKIAPKYDKELAYHEEVEYKARKRLAKESKFKSKKEK